MIAGIELGGTKTVLALGSDDGSLGEQHRFPTTTPTETMATAADWIRKRGPVSALGIAAFGPLGVLPAQVHYGQYLRTPKEDWRGFDLVGFLQGQLPEVPICLDTDVNGAVLAEVSAGAAQGLSSAAYITIGTGIGGGVIAEGRLLHGALHSELGHILPPRHPDDAFAGLCPSHGACLEGLASGPALAARWGRPAHEIPAAHPAWEMEAWYLAHGVLALLAIACPARVIIGGGVSQAEGFHAKVEERLRNLANGYFSTLEESVPYVVPPLLEQNAGIQGALLLAISR